MGYDIGISTGWYNLAKQTGGGGDLLGMAAKVAYGATAGIRFTQIDLETITEFLEPDVQRKLKQIMDGLGMKVGLHAEVSSMALESADRVEWESSHRRLVESVHYAKKFGFVYINIHTCEKPQLWMEEAQIRPFGHQHQTIDPEGKPFSNLCDKSKAAKDHFYRSFLEHMKRYGLVDDEQQDEIDKKRDERIIKATEENLDKSVANYMKTEEYREIISSIEADVVAGRKTREQADKSINKQITLARNQLYEGARQKAIADFREPPPDDVYEGWKKSKFGRYFIWSGEIGAYLLVAWHMYKNNHPLWKQLANNKNPDDCYHSNQHGFNAAVASYYIYNHLTLKDHQHNRDYLGGMSVLEFLNKNGLYVLFETPESKGARTGGSTEGLLRFYDPVDTYYFLKYVNSSFVKMCIDFEHVLSQKVEIEDMMNRLPKDGGSMVYLFHLTKPVPYGGGAHAHLMRGSRSQELVYKWLYDLRQRGFKNGIMIYERGGGQHPQDVIKESVLVLRLLKEYLEKDIPPNELPLSFYGVSEQNEATWKRQLVMIRDHAWDPLVGMLSIPEETHTFFSKAAVEKGKAEEWKKGKFR
ncbi:MAG: hypothetical protein ABIA21_03325 [Candidatus Aenigmatarchaeota archaeon]